jgi:two-component system cell cycle sensor histidine kinase/response regulator CckA
MTVTRWDKAKGNPEEARPESGLAAASVPGGPAMVYIVDDHVEVGELVEAFLKMAGYRTRLFQDPRAALTAMGDANAAPDLLVTDFVMEGLNGIELIEQALRLKPDLKTILISGNVGEQILQKFATRPDRFLRKPFLSQKLAEMVSSLLEKKA